MGRWEVAVQEFLERWKENPEVCAALVCGSYVTGEPNSHSDIDLHIILNDEVNWRERGNQYIDGFLIEYFANPPVQIREYFTNDFRSYQTSSMVQFLTGRTIFDRTGIIGDLKEEALKWKEKPYEPLSATTAEFQKYGLWDIYDNLLVSYKEEKLEFSQVYYQSMYALFRGYSVLLNLERIPFNQMVDYLSNPKYLQKYLKKPFPDNVFAKLLLEAVACHENQRRIALFSDMLEHVFLNSGGFEIDGWKVRTPVGC